MNFTALIVLLTIVFIWSVAGVMIWRLVGPHIVEIRTTWIRALIVGPVVWLINLLKRFQ